MMTLKELENKLMELKVQIAELKKQGEEPPEPPHPRWIPKDKEIYYTIMYSCGIIDILNWSDTKPSHERFKLGNVYKTRAEAEFAAERLKVLAEMREWSGNAQFGAQIYYHKPSDKIMIDWDGNSNYVYGDIRFKSVEDAENCIKAVGEDRIKKYYFMIMETKYDPAI